MKSAIHPAYHLVEVRCACGHTIQTRSTSAALHVELCSHCHPFFTGKARNLDLTGRLEKFTNKYAKVNAAKEAAAVEAAAAKKS